MVAGIKPTLIIIDEASYFMEDSITENGKKGDDDMGNKDKGSKDKKRPKKKKEWPPKDKMMDSDRDKGLVTTK